MGKADPAWLWDQARGRIVWANHAGITFWGEASLFDLLDHRFDPDGATVRKIREIADKLSEGDGKSDEVIFFHEAGQLVKCSCSITALEDGRKGILIAAARAGGKKQDAGAGLMEQIVAHTPFALAVFDRGGRLLFANPTLRANIAPADPEAERGAGGPNFALGMWLGSEDAAHKLVSRILLVGSHSEARPLRTKFGMRTHRLTARRLSGDDGETSILIVFQDIEDRRKYERDMQARLEKLEAAEKARADEAAEPAEPETPDAAPAPDGETGGPDAAPAQGEAEAPATELAPEKPEALSEAATADSPPAGDDEAERKGGNGLKGAALLASLGTAAVVGGSTAAKADEPETAESSEAEDSEAAETAEVDAPEAEEQPQEVKAAEEVHAPEASGEPAHETSDTAPEADEAEAEEAAPEPGAAEAEAEATSAPDAEDAEPEPADTEAEDTSGEAEDNEPQQAAAEPDESLAAPEERPEAAEVSETATDEREAEETPVPAEEISEAAEQPEESAPAVEADDGEPTAEPETSAAENASEAEEAPQAGEPSSEEAAPEKGEAAEEEEASEDETTSETEAASEEEETSEEETTGEAEPEVKPEHESLAQAAGLAALTPEEETESEPEDEPEEANSLHGRDKAAFNAIAEALRSNNPITARQIRIGERSEMIALKETQAEPEAEPEPETAEAHEAPQPEQPAEALPAETLETGGEASAEDEPTSEPEPDAENTSAQAQDEAAEPADNAPVAEAPGEDAPVTETATAEDTPAEASETEAGHEAEPAEDAGDASKGNDADEAGSVPGLAAAVPAMAAFGAASAIKAGEGHHLKDILDSAVDGIVTLDGKGLVCDMNSSAESILGLAGGEMDGKPFTDLLSEASARTMHSYLEAVTETGVAGPFRDGREIEARRKDGAAVPLFMTIGPVTSDDTLEYCAVIRDISQWKNAETELRLAKERAEQDNEKKSDFLARISHELRTPLNAIMGFSEVMSEEKFGPIANDRYKGYVSDIRNSSEHLLSLVNDLLDLTKIESGHLDLDFTSVNLGEIVSQCVSLMQPQATRERIVMRTSMPDNLPPVVADHRSLRQIVLNLLSNAVKFTRAGGQVIVSAVSGEEGEIRLQVRDTGIGMDAEELTRAMEPYRQIKAVNESGLPGTGLGLPLTKALAEANRAEFRISSEKDKGTLVQIIFPTTRVLAE